MNNKLKQTIHKLAPAVFTSLIATSLGLLSLYTSNVPMIQDFGMMLAIGIGVAFLLALMVLLPILVTKDKLHSPTKQVKTTKPSLYQNILKKFARFVTKTKYIIIVIAVLLAGVGFFLDQFVDVETDVETFMPQDSIALADIQELRDIIGSTERIVLLYEADDITSYQTLQDVKGVTSMLQTQFNEEILNIASVSLFLDQVSNNNWDEQTHATYLNKLPQDQLRLLQDTQTKQGIINLSLQEMSDEEFLIFVDALETSLTQQSLSTLEITITGQSIVDQEMLKAMTSNRLTMTLLGIGLVFIALLLIYKKPFKALIAILPIILIVGWSGGIMYLFGFDYTPLTSTLGALIIGIGTEFTILILMRYYDFKQTSCSNQESIEKAIETMGRPIIVSAVTTMGGFSALILSDFAILSNFGIMTVINLSLALMSALVVLPALLGVMTKNKTRIT